MLQHYRIAAKAGQSTGGLSLCLGSKTAGGSTVRICRILSDAAPDIRRRGALGRHLLQPGGRVLVLDGSSTLPMPVNPCKYAEKMVRSVRVTGALIAELPRGKGGRGKTTRTAASSFYEEAGISHGEAHGQGTWTNGFYRVLQ